MNLPQDIRMIVRILSLYFGAVNSYFDAVIRGLK